RGLSLAWGGSGRPTARAGPQSLQGKGQQQTPERSPGKAGRQVESLTILENSDFSGRYLIRESRRPKEAALRCLRTVSLGSAASVCMLLVHKQGQWVKIGFARPGREHGPTTPLVLLVSFLHKHICMYYRQSQRRLGFLITERRMPMFK